MVFIGLHHLAPFKTPMFSEGSQPQKIDFNKFCKRKVLIGAEAVVHTETHSS